MVKRDRAMPSTTAAAPVGGDPSATDGAEESSAGDNGKAGAAIGAPPPWAYAVLLLLRVACIALPGIVDPNEAHGGGQEVFYSLFFPREDEGGAWTNADRLPADMSGANPTQSMLPATITNFVPYTALYALNRGARPSMLQAYLAPRLWMFVLSLLTDALTADCMAYVGGAGRESVLFLLASAWPTLVLAVRPVNGAVEMLALAGCLHALLAVRSHLVRSAIFFGWLCVGIFARVTFLAYILVYLNYLYALSSRSGAEVRRPLLVGATLGVLVFVGAQLLLGAYDSLFFGQLSATVAGVEYANLPELIRAALASPAKVLPQLAHASVRGSLTFPPYNALVGLRWANWRVKMLESFAPAQMFFYLPLILGPLVVVLVSDSWESLRKLYKEVLAEIQASSGAARKKRRARKLPESARSREEDFVVYTDTTELALTVGLSMDVLFSASRSGFATALPLLVPAVLMLHDKVYGKHAVRWLSRVWVVYSALAVLFFGVLHNSGATRLALDASARGVGAIVGGGAAPAAGGAAAQPPPVLLLHRVYAPQPVLLSRESSGQPAAKLVTVDVRGKNLHAAAMKQRAEYGASGRKVYVVAPATERLDKLDGFVRVASYRAHLSVDSLPANFDSLLTQSRLHVYELTEVAEEIPSAEAAEEIVGSFHQQNQRAYDEL